MAVTEHHLDRARAESFGATADDYDRHRPPYAGALFDELAALAPDRTLDVGCGTGRAAVGLATRGLDVLGVEPDERMAALARAHGVTVETAPFEDWDDAGRRFDLLVCGAAWHWVEPVRGAAKAATVLRPGGTFARFWCYPVLPDAVATRLEGVYAEHAPDAHPHGRRPEPHHDDPIAAGPAFTTVTTTLHEEERAFTTDDWIALIRTFSDHAALAPECRSALVDALRAAIDDLGGSLEATCCTHVLRCRRASS